MPDKDTFRVLVFGGRDYTDQDTADYCLDKLFGAALDKIEYVIHGAYYGADTCADKWARNHNLKVWRFPAEWQRYGSSAGPRRNRMMRDVGKPDIAVGFPGGRGSKNMLSLLREAEVKTILVDECGNMSLDAA